MEGGFNSLATPERSADGFFEPADYGVGANSAPPRSRRGGGVVHANVGQKLLNRNIFSNFTYFLH